MLKSGRSRVMFPMRLLESSIDLLLPDALWLSGVHSAPNRNEFHKFSWGVKGGRTARKVDSFTAHNSVGLYDLLQE
jgi:hypothetical protein